MKPILIILLAALLPIHTPHAAETTLPTSAAADYHEGKNPGTWTDITASYAADLTTRYNAWLKEKHPPQVLRQWREAAGLNPDAAIPRLNPDQFGKASLDRFHAEAEFYLAVERDFYLGMARFLRADVQPARKTIERSYTAQQVRESILLTKREHRPYFTPGFPLLLPLQHGSRISSLAGPASAPMPALTDSNAIHSDTGELTWLHGEKGSGLVAVNTDRSQALVGFVGARPFPLKHLAVEVRPPFCAITLSSLDSRPIALASQLLLTASARMANTGMVWNEQRNSLQAWGDAPTRIEPVTGRIHLAGIENAESIIAVPLNGAGVATETTIKAVRDGERWTLTLSAPALSYRIDITR